MPMRQLLSRRACAPARRTTSVAVSLAVVMAFAVRSVALAQVDASESSKPLRIAKRLPEGITPQAAAAIDRGLAYLARTQDRQGSWANLGNYGSYPVAMTALAGLALLMDGNTTTQGRYAVQVDRAARYLTRASSQNGLIALTDHEPRPMYGHGFAMLFLSQLYGMTEDTRRADELRDVLDRGIQLTARA